MEFYKNKRVVVSKKDDSYAGKIAYYQFHFDHSTMVMLCDKMVSECGVGPFHYFSVEEGFLEEVS